MVSHINRTYIAAGGKVYPESLPYGYKSASFVNDSGHYLLLRLGGSDGPVDPSSADLTIPPYTAAGVSLSGDLLALRFTDNVGGAGAAQLASVATGVDGICSASYSPDPISPYLVALPGAVQSVVVPPTPPAGAVWTRIAALNDFTAPLQSVHRVVSGPCTVRAVRVSYSGYASTGGTMNVYVAADATPAVVLDRLAQGQVDKLTGVAAYLLPVEWQAGAGAEVVLPINQSVYAQCAADLVGVLTYAEYHT